MAQPKLKINELAKSINSLVLTGRKPNASEINRLKNELGKSITAKNAEYYDFLGRIAVLENNKTRMIDYCKDAVFHSFNKNYDIQESYLLCLNNSGLFSKAKEQLKVISERFPTHPKVIKKQIANSRALCRVRELANLIKTEGEPLDDDNWINQAISIFDKADLSDDEAENLCKLAYSTLETQNLYFSGWEIEIIDDCVLYTIYVDLPIEDIFETNWELANVFAENVEDMRSDVLMFEYSSVDVWEEKENHERFI